MNRKAQSTREKSDLPSFLRPLFWNRRFSRLRWSKHWTLVTEQVLAWGGWKEICWLRKKLGDEKLRDFILDREGRFLGRRQLRYWQLILKLSPRLVDAWLADPARKIWEGRRAELRRPRRIEGVRLVEKCADHFRISNRVQGGVNISIAVPAAYANLWLEKLTELNATKKAVQWARFNGPSL